MTTTTTRYQEFEFGATFLKNVFDWINKEVDIEDIFDREQIIEYVKDNFYDPDDLFDKKVLEEWARDNGFVEEKSE